MLLIKLQKVIFVSNQNIVPIKKSVVALAVCCIKARTSLEMDGTVNILMGWTEIPLYHPKNQIFSGKFFG